MEGRAQLDQLYLTIEQEKNLNLAQRGKRIESGQNVADSQRFRRERVLDLWRHFALNPFRWSNRG